MNAAVRPLVVIALLLASVAVYLIRPMVAPTEADPVRVAKVQRRLDALPMSIADGKYSGRRRSHEQELVVKSGADSHTAAIFFTENRESQFSIYIGGSTSPDVAFHSPDICLPAAGWELVEETLVEFDAFPSSGVDNKMRRLLVRLGEDERLCYFWFQSGDEVADSIWKARFFNLRERLRGQPNQPTYIVVVYSPVTESLRHADLAARSFMRAMGPHLLAAVQEHDDT